MDDRKIKYVDLNGLKFFAEELKDYLHNHVLETSMFNELDTRISALEGHVFYKVLNELPEEPESDPKYKNTIWLIPNPDVEGQHLEYIWTTNGWEQLGVFSFDVVLEDFVKKEDSPFEKGDVENSAVLKGVDNQVISEGGVALGENNVVGLKGWYYKALRINTAAKTIDVFLTKNQTIPISGKPSNIETDIVCNLITGDTISVVNDKKYDNKFVVVNTSFLSNGFIRIQAIDDLPFTTIEQELILDPEDYSIYCLSKPDAGIVDIGQDSFASGYYNKATNGKATAFGFNNHAYGKFSFVEGRGNKAGYAAHAEGRDNKANGEKSHAEGDTTISSGKASHSEGKLTESSGDFSHSEGTYTKASGKAAHAEGLGTKDILVEAKGEGAHAEGRRTRALNNGSHAEGNNNETKSDDSHVEGANNKIESGASCAHSEGAANTTKTGAQFSHVEGVYNSVSGEASHAEGFYTETTNSAEHAEGEYNKSNTGTRHSVGIGTSDTNRKNAFEIMQNGKHYIYGIGDYDGTNAVTANAQGIIAKSVQEVINELVNKLNEITISETI